MDLHSVGPSVACSRDIWDALPPSIAPAARPRATGALMQGTWTPFEGQHGEGRFITDKLPMETGAAGRGPW